MRPGWAPPAGWAPPGGAFAAPLDPDPGGRLLSGRALALVGVSIGLGGVYQIVVRVLEKDQHMSIGSVITWNIILVLALYAIVGTLVVSQVKPEIRLRWGDGSPLLRVAYGASFGLLGAGLAVAAQSAVQHGLSTDPRAVQMMGEGDLGHILIALLILTVAAPMVEETLFRGLLLEALRRNGRRTAVIGSALCFAIWHFNKAAIVYYTLMGCVFAGIYLKRGLLSSMSAHAAFNGTLTVVGILIVLGPAHVHTVGGLQITVPGGWTVEHLPTDASDFLAGPEPLFLDGPDGSGLGMYDLGPLSRPFSAEEVAQNLRELNVPLPEGSSYDANTIREVQLPTVGTTVEVNFTIHSSGGEMAFFSYGNDGYFIFSVTHDSPKAETDYEKMITTLQPTGGASAP